MSFSGSNVDVPHKLNVRLRIYVEDDIFFDRVQPTLVICCKPLIKQYGIFKVARVTVGFLDDDMGNIVFLNGGKLHHLPKDFSFFGRRCIFSQKKLFNHYEFFAGAVVAG